MFQVYHLTGKSQDSILILSQTYIGTFQHQSWF
nr:MAG TPA: hypothetical protein [Caudoviricetes sp.]